MKLRHHFLPPMPFFACKLIPPRATFPADITAEEMRVMQEHVAYWMRLAKAGTAIAFGPVADPAGSWGLGILEAPNIDAVLALQAKDPTTLSGLGFRHEAYLMPQLVVRDRLAP
jgi:uncharacterized protein